MFDNIGEKIKTLAVVTTWVGIIASIVGGFVMLVQGTFEGLLVMVFGSLGAWIGSFVLYGFGQLITNTDVIAASAKGNEGSASKASAPADAPVAAAPAAPAQPWCCANCSFTNHPRVGTCQRCGVTKEWSDGQQNPDRT